MWFKNLKLYRLTQAFSHDDQQLQQRLSEFAFRPCQSQEISTTGWTAPIRGGDMLFHLGSGNYLFCLQKQERILPAAVLNAKVAEKVAEIERETGSPVGKKAQQEMKEQLTMQMLPQAFTKDTFTWGFISPAANLVVVDAAGDGKAEAFLSHLRKTLESLPVVPWARRSVAAELTSWLTDNPPEEFELKEEAELRQPEEGGAVARFKNQDLGSDEVLTQIENGKVVSKLAIHWDETFSAIVQDTVAISRLKFSDMLREQNADIDKADRAARLDADFCLMAGEVVRFAERLNGLFGLQQDGI